MRPHEFISRALDLIEFDVGPGWPKARPDDFSSAHLQVAAARKGPAGDVRLHHHGYLYVFESGTALAHRVLRVWMVPTPIREEAEVSMERLLDMTHLCAAICFVEGGDVVVQGQAPEDHLMESWHMSSDVQQSPNLLTEMISYLVLKTQHRIRKVHKNI